MGGMNASPPSLTSVKKRLRSLRLMVQSLPPRYWIMGGVALYALSLVGITNRVESLSGAEFYTDDSAGSVAYAGQPGRFCKSDEISTTCASVYPEQFQPPLPNVPAGQQVDVALVRDSSDVIGCRAVAVTVSGTQYPTGDYRWQRLGYVVSFWILLLAWVVVSAATMRAVRHKSIPRRLSVAMPIFGMPFVSVVVVFQSALAGAFGGC